LTIFQPDEFIIGQYLEISKNKLHIPAEAAGNMGYLSQKTGNLTALPQGEI